MGFFFFEWIIALQLPAWASLNWQKLRNIVKFTLIFFIIQREHVQSKNKKEMRKESEKKRSEAKNI